MSKLTSMGWYRGGTVGKRMLNKCVGWAGGKAHNMHVGYVSRRKVHQPGVGTCQWGLDLAIGNFWLFWKPPGLSQISSITGSPLSSSPCPPSLSSVVLMLQAACQPACCLDMAFGCIVEWCVPFIHLPPFQHWLSSHLLSCFAHYSDCFPFSPHPNSSLLNASNPPINNISSHKAFVHPGTNFSSVLDTLTDDTLKCISAGTSFPNTNALNIPVPLTNIDVFKHIRTGMPVHPPPGPITSDYLQDTNSCQLKISISPHSNPQPHQKPSTFEHGPLAHPSTLESFTKDLLKYTSTGTSAYANTSPTNALNLFIDSTPRHKVLAHPSTNVPYILDLFPGGTPECTNSDTLVHAGTNPTITPNPPPSDALEHGASVHPSTKVSNGSCSFINGVFEWIVTHASVHPNTNILNILHPHIIVRIFCPNTIVLVMLANIFKYINTNAPAHPTLDYITTTVPAHPNASISIISNLFTNNHFNHPNTFAIIV